MQEHIMTGMFVRFVAQEIPVFGQIPIRFILLVRQQSRPIFRLLMMKFHLYSHIV